jgi:hypothetical protein
MKGRFFLLTLFITGLLITTTARAFAVTPPDFPACSAQVGAPIIATYSGGTHGVVGDTKTYTGSDTVYAVDAQNKVLQCFCGVDGSGIQTNWWKASSLTDADIKILVNQGWHYVQNGSIWGLSDEPYIGKNIEFACGGKGGGFLSSETTENLLGLASTGNNTFLYEFFLLAVATTGTGILLKKFASK